MLLSIPLFILGFLLGLLLVGFLLVNALAAILALFGIILPVFGVIEYISVGFILVYIRGYFNKDLDVGGIVRKRFSEIKNKDRKETK